MNFKKLSTWLLLALFLTGSGLISNGLANLPEAYQKTSVIIMAPNLEEALKLKPKKKIDADTIETERATIDNKQSYNIKSGDTLSHILQSYNIDDMEVAYIVSEIDDVYHLNQLRPGMLLDIELFDDKTEFGAKHLKSLKFKPSITEVITLTGDDKGEFNVVKSEIPLEKILIRATGEIEGSLYQSATRAGITDSVMAQLIAALSYEVDFQRDIQAGHKFTILFEAYTDKDGGFIKSNRPLYTKLEMGKRVVEIYFIEKADGTIGYYKADGTSVKKALLRTPIDGARITSGFGMRRHPILGFSKMHKGTDFGAPTGTPIYAAGDGTIEKMGYFGAYGNYVRIRHNGTYATAYGHISRFARGMKAGMKVKQGQIVAFVGATGRATGPHLHFEVLEKGVQINPISAKLPLSDKLGGKELASFQAQKHTITAALDNAMTRAELEDKHDNLKSAMDKKVSAEPATAPTAAPTPAKN
jgi:murein DD-endopeptidase MepM/ murein hydrolase activator NlpD